MYLSKYDFVFTNICVVISSNAFRMINNKLNTIRKRKHEYVLGNTYYVLANNKSLNYSLDCYSHINRYVI